MTYHALIVAGGSGQRAGGAKQWWLLNNKPVVLHSIETFMATGVSQIVVVVPKDSTAKAHEILGHLSHIHITGGGNSRSQSVQNGLSFLKTMAKDSDCVLIHDAARPLVKPDQIRAILEALTIHQAAILASPLSDSLKHVKGGLITKTIARDGLWRAQTPQAFRLGDIMKAHDQWPTDQDATDDAMIAEAAGIEVGIVQGDIFAHKITNNDDMLLLNHLATKDNSLFNNVKIGMGFDAHRLGEGLPLMLCGVKIDHESGLIGHSDADVALHALTDAILGACALGDIGDHFPPSDPRFKGMASDIFLIEALRLMSAQGFALGNIDLTIMAERPKIKPHRFVMREKLAELCAIPIENISLKATTTEGMGFTGREEGIAAQAVCLVIRK